MTACATLFCCNLSTLNKVLIIIIGQASQYVQTFGLQSEIFPEIVMMCLTSGKIIILDKGYFKHAKYIHAKRHFLYPRIRTYVVLTWFAIMAMSSSNT